jgi:hypothetical protein
VRVLPVDRGEGSERSVAGAEGPAGARARRVATWVGRALVIAAGLAYVAILVQRLPAFLSDIVPTSDTISPTVLVQALSSPGHGAVYLGAHAAYSDLLLASPSLLFGALRSVPEALPYAAYIVGALLLAEGARRVAGRLGALVSITLALCSAPVTLLNEMSPAGRVPTLTNICLLGLAVVVVLFATPAARSSWIRLALGVLLLGALSGFDVASDPLLSLVGVLPFVVTALTVWWASRRDPRRARLALSAVGVGAVASVFFALTFRGASSLFRLTYDAPHVHLASASVADYNLHLLGGDSRVAIGGTWSYVSANSVGTLEAAIGVLVVLAAVGALVIALRMVARTRQATGRDRARGGYALFWSLVALTNVIAYLATDLPVSLWAMRYLTPSWLALAALVPLVPTTRLTLHLTTLAAVAALAAANAWALGTMTLAAPEPETAVARTLVAEHVTRAYADYWDANLISWWSSGKVRVTPVNECGADHAQLCPYRVNAAAAWFLRTSRPVAVVLDPRYSVKVPPSGVYGQPNRVVHVGAIAIYEYAHGLTLADP